MRSLLHDTGRDDLVDASVLLVSELVTNAMLHAGTTILVSARVDDGVLCIEVGDGSPHLPVRRHYSSTSGTGRGLMMLEELVDDWGVSRHEDGKTVWFRVGSPGATASTDSYPALAPPAEPVGGCADIELRNVPLLLHSAWQEQAEAMLRELLLASLDEAAEGDLDPIQVHAEATDAIAVLEEQIPRVHVEVEPDRLMDGATEPFVTAESVTVRVARSSVPHFETLDTAIRDALDLSARGLTMTPPTQPEIQVFRHWLCREVLEQAGGARPSPWSVDVEPPVQPEFSLDWDADVVREATSGRVAADEANRILAVSRPLLALLGYDDPAELLGRRTVALIPERYRQAHIAGFTMFLLSGRQPLLGRPVVVPALRRDGSEVMVDLLVSTQSVGDGRTLFLAEMSPAGTTG